VFSLSVKNLAALSALLLPSLLTAQEKPQPAPSKPPAPPAQKAEIAKPQPTAEKKEIPSSISLGPKKLADFTKGHIINEGLFKLYRDPAKGTHYLYITKEQLGREFIYFTHGLNGPVATGHYRGHYGECDILRFYESYDKVRIYKHNTRYYYDPQHPLARSAEANVSHAMLAKESVVAKDEKGYLISLESLFLGEKLLQVKPTGMEGSKAVLGKLNEAKGSLTASSYPKNTVIKAGYVFETSSPSLELQEQEDVADARYVSVAIQHSLIAMPEAGYSSRVDDPRIGYFSSEVDDMTSAEVTPRRDFIHRWRLDKKDPKAALSEPVKPITYWIENTTPVEIREIIRTAGLRWNAAFEKIGFKNAIDIQIQPDDAKWNADDLDYNVLRWVASPTPPFGGYGPKFYNPRTGEILGTDIMLEYSSLTRRMFSERVFTEATPLDTSEQNTDPQSCALASIAQQGFLRGAASLRLRPADKIQTKQLLQDYLTKLILHEIGHTLGLNHNFKASHLHDPVAIHNKELTSRVGLYGSVMDYPMINLAPHGTPQGEFFMTCVGPYDLWAIDYGYSPASADSQEESARLAKIASRSHEPQLAFGNDADDMRKVGSGVDPDAMIYDLSSDPVTYAQQRCERDAQDLAALMKEFPAEGMSHHELVYAYNIIQKDKLDALTAASRFIGGVHVERAYKGQGAQRAPYTAVPEQKQKQAMAMLSQHAFGPTAWTASAELLSHLQSQRRGFDFRKATEDPKILEGIFTAQTTTLSHLLDSNTLRRLLNSALYGNTYTLDRMLQDLTDAIILGDPADQPVSSTRANLQLEYVQRLLALVRSRNQEANIQGNALLQVNRIKDLISKADSAFAKSPAHQQLLAFRIKQDLEEK
jgi:hypothetical protein